MKCWTVPTLPAGTFLSGTVHQDSPGGLYESTRGRVRPKKGQILYRVLCRTREDARDLSSKYAVGRFLLFMLLPSMHLGNIFFFWIFQMTQAYSGSSTKQEYESDLSTHHTLSKKQKARVPPMGKYLQMTPLTFSQIFGQFVICGQWNFFPYTACGNVLSPELVLVAQRGPGDSPVQWTFLLAFMPSSVLAPKSPWEASMKPQHMVARDHVGQVMCPSTPDCTPDSLSLPFHVLLLPTSLQPPQ